MLKQLWKPFKQYIFVTLTQETTLHIPYPTNSQRRFHLTLTYSCTNQYFHIYNGSNEIKCVM